MCTNNTTCPGRTGRTACLRRKSRPAVAGSKTHLGVQLPQAAHGECAVAVADESGTSQVVRRQQRRHRVRQLVDCLQARACTLPSLQRLVWLTCTSRGAGKIPEPGKGLRHHSCALPQTASGRCECGAGSMVHAGDCTLPPPHRRSEMWRASATTTGWPGAASPSLRTNVRYGNCSAGPEVKGSMTACDPCRHSLAVVHGRKP